MNNLSIFCFMYCVMYIYNISGDHTAPWQRGDQLGPGAGPPLSVRPGQQNSQGKTVDNHDSQRYKSPDLGGKRDDRKSEQIRLNKSVLYQAKSVCTKVPLKAVKTRLSTRFWLVYKIMKVINVKSKFCFINVFI